MTSGEDYDQFIGDDDGYVVDRPPDAWGQLPDARRAALAVQLGQPLEEMYHSPIPFYLGGNAEVMVFPNYVEGMTYVTADLIGDIDQVQTALGNYELMMCVRGDAPWAAGIVSELARYTTHVSLNHGDTMDYAGFSESQIKALLFALPDIPSPRFEVLGKRCGLLLCIGITLPELMIVREQGADALVTRLRGANVFPYTDPARNSVV